MTLHVTLETFPLEVTGFLVVVATARQAVGHLQPIHKPVANATSYPQGTVAPV